MQWLTAAGTRDKLASIVISLRFAVTLLGALFRDARRFEDAHSPGTLTGSILQFILHDGRSAPAPIRVITNHLDMLQDERDSRWQPLLHHDRPWSADLYLIGSVPSLLMLAQVTPLGRGVWAW